MRSSKRSKPKTKWKVSVPLTASLLSSSLMSAIAWISIVFFDADPQACFVLGTFFSVMLACFLMMEDEDRLN